MAASRRRTNPRQPVIAGMGLLVTAASALTLMFTVHAGGNRSLSKGTSLSSPPTHMISQKNSARLEAFSHHLKVRTRFSEASALTGPSVLAGVFGKMRVYLSERKGRVCIRILEGKAESAGCAPADEIESIGDVNVRRNRSGRIGVVMVLPNGVESAMLVDHGGSSRRIPVTNNVAAAYDSRVSAVTYKLANGELRTINIPAEFLLPRRPSR